MLPPRRGTSFLFPPFKVWGIERYRLEAKRQFPYIGSVYFPACFFFPNGKKQAIFQTIVKLFRVLSRVEYFE